MLPFSSGCEFNQHFERNFFFIDCEFSVHALEQFMHNLKNQEPFSRIFYQKPYQTESKLMGFSHKLAGHRRFLSYSGRNSWLVET